MQNGALQTGLLPLLFNGFTIEDIIRDIVLQIVLMFYNSRDINF